MNVKYVQGVGPGYWPTAGSNLVLNLAPGTAVCSNVVETYAGGTLTLAPSATNYVYLDTTHSCAPASNTTGFTSATIPLATVVTSSTAISSVTDVRTMFVSNGAGGASGGGSVTSVGMTGDGIIFNTAVAGSPVTASGTLSPQLLTHTANTVLAGPNSGPAATPSFRNLTAADLPLTISSNTTGNASTATALSAGPTQCGANSWATGVSANGNANCSQPGFGNISGAAGITQGGTGQTTASAAFNALSPLTAEGDLLYYHSSANARLAAGTSGQCLTMSGSDPAWGSCSTGSGTVTSVGLSLPSIFSVSGSPVTQSGTLAASLANENANLVMAGPASGSGTAPTFRSLVGADLPTPTATSLGGIESVICATGLFLNQISTGGVPSCGLPSGGGSGSSTGLGNGTTVIDASLQPGTDFGSKVNAAIAACPSTGCTVDARGFTSPQTMSTSINLTANGPYGIINLLLPKGTINRANGAVFNLYSGDSVIGQGGLTYTNAGTFISNSSGDTSTVFANATGGGLVGVYISDLTVYNNGTFTVKDLNGNTQTPTYATGTCFDFSNAAYIEVDRVFAQCQTVVKLSNPSYTGSYYNHFANDSFSFTNPNGVGVYLGEYPNSNQFEDCKFSGAGTAIFSASSGGWTRFIGGNIENAGAGIVVYSGGNNHFQDMYFESVGPSTGSPYYSVWQANWPYIQGAAIADSSGHIYICVAPGTSGTSTPSWNTSTGGSSTTDGGATWMYVGTQDQVVWGPNAVGNYMDGTVGPSSVGNYSQWGSTANIVSSPPGLAGGSGIEPGALAADNFNIGGGIIQSYTGAPYQYVLSQANDSGGPTLSWSGFAKWGSNGLWGLAPFRVGGLLSQGGFGTYIANQLTVAGVTNPGAPTVTLSSSHSGTSTVSYALTAWCGAEGGYNTSSTLVGSFTPITNAPSTPGALISATVANGGSGYTNGATVTITGGVVSALGTGTATATITVSSGVVTAVTITSPGYGYIDGSAAVSTSGGGGTGLTINITAYALVEVTPAPVSYGLFASNPMSGCHFDLVKDPAGGTSTSQAVSTKQGLIASTGFTGMLLDYGSSLVAYSAPTRNNTADEVHNGYVTFNNVPSDGTTVACLDSSHDLSTGCPVGSVTSFSAGSLSPLFSTSVATATSTPALSFSLSSVPAHSWFGNATASSAVPAFNTSALPASLLPAPTASTLGGIESIASTAHNWVQYVDTSGIPHLSQPASTDLSDYGSIANAALASSSVTFNSAACSLGSTCNITQLNDSNGNPTVKSVATASAVDYVTATNAATGGNVYLASAGSDTNIPLYVQSKGSGAMYWGTTSAGGNFYYSGSSGYHQFYTGSTLQVSINNSGYFSKYAAQSTSGVGVPFILGVSNVTNLSSSQSTVNLISSTSAAGSYLIRWYADESTACTTSASGGVTFTFSWTDAKAARSATATLNADTSSGTGSYASGVISIYSASGDAISYSTNYTASCGSGTFAYDIHASVERMQ